MFSRIWLRTWGLSKDECNVYFKAVGQAARRVLGLPPCCPSDFVNNIHDCEVTKAHTYKKTLSLIDSFRKSDNAIMNMIYTNAISDPYSYMSRNLYRISKEWNSLKKPSFVENITPAYLGIIEMLDVRDGRCHIELETDEVDIMILMMCMR